MQSSCQQNPGKRIESEVLLICFKTLLGFVPPESFYFLKMSASFSMEGYTWLNKMLVLNALYIHI